MSTAVKVSALPAATEEEILLGLGLSPVDGIANCPICDRPTLGFGGWRVMCSRGCTVSAIADRFAELGRIAGGAVQVAARIWSDELRLGALVTLTTMSKVESLDVRWFWEGRSPAGMITVLDGDSGVGKSALTFDLIARVTTGRALPGEIRKREPSNAILLGHEDSAAHTIRPRLDAAGADTSRVHLIEDVRGRLPHLPDDSELLEQVIASKGASLLVIDPISAYLGGADLHRDNDVRSALAPLAAVAERSGAAILLLRHLRKSGGVSALYRGLGSVALTALARSTMMLLRDPEDPECRIVAWPKLSVGPQPASLRWRFVATEPGRPPRIQWEEAACTLSADDVLDLADARDRPKSKVDEAAAFLRDALASGPVASADLESRAREAGFGQSCYDRARNKAGVRRLRVGDRWLSTLEPRTSSPGRDGVAVLDVLDADAERQGHQGYQERQESLLGGSDVLDDPEVVS